MNSKQLQEEMIREVEESQEQVDRMSFMMRLTISDDMQMHVSLIKGLVGYSRAARIIDQLELVE